MPMKMANTRVDEMMSHQLYPLCKKGDVRRGMPKVSYRSQVTIGGRIRGTHPILVNLLLDNWTKTDVGTACYATCAMNEATMYQ